MLFPTGRTDNHALITNSAPPRLSQLVSPKSQRGYVSLSHFTRTAELIRGFCLATNKVRRRVHRKKDGHPLTFFR